MLKKIKNITETSLKPYNTVEEYILNAPNGREILIVLRELLIFVKVL